MVCVYVRDVMDFVFSVCIVRCGAIAARVWEVYMLYVCVLCAHHVAVLIA